VISIAGYIIDAAISEEHTLDSEVTEFPVESGSNVTDNVRPLPATVVIEGVVSDTPIEGMVAVRSASTTLPSQEALDLLLRIRADREPVAVETSLRRYETMVLESLSIPRDAETGHALRFSATFREIIIVVNERTTVKVATPLAGKKKKLGAKTPVIQDTAPMFRRVNEFGMFERVYYVKDPSKPDKLGYFSKADGKTPLNDEELRDWEEYNPLGSKFVQRREEERRLSNTLAPWQANDIRVAPNLKY
jgi:hypothetical protein